MKSMIALSLLLFSSLTIQAVRDVPLGQSDPGKDPVTCTPSELRTYSTIHSVGIEWDITGDADHDAMCDVRYRAKGSRNWKRALPLMRVDYYGWYDNGKADRAYNMLAGSILFLRPGTTYEVKLALTDPDGAGENRTVSIATRPIPRISEGGHTYHVVPGSGEGSGSPDHPFQGLARSQAVAKPGDTLLLHRGSYGSFKFDRSGDAGRYIIWKEAGDGDAVLGPCQVSAHHLWFQGITFASQQAGNALLARGPCENVVISRNTFTGFHYSVFLNPQCRDWYIADNVIVGDNDPIEGGIGGEGIELNHSSGHTVCYNRISRVADGVSYPHRNCDIFGNDIFDVSDDGLEPDYGYANVRMWDNRITNAKHAALSFQPMYCGPWYFIRNQYIGDGQAFKFRVQDRFVLANNTFVRWGEMDYRMHLLLTSLSRNNLFISISDTRPVWMAFYYGEDHQQKYVLIRDFKPDWRTDVDYDGFDWDGAPIAFRWDDGGSNNFKDLADFTRATGIETHGRRVRKEEIFENWNVPAKLARIDPNIMLGLKAKCDAVDAGDVLPNINDGYVGKAPDLGAHELGKPMVHYGPRMRR